MFLKESQEAFARKLNVNNSTLSKYEVDLRRPDPDFFVKIKKISGVDLNWLIVGEGEMFSVNMGVIAGNKDLARQIDERTEEIRRLLGKFQKLAGSE